MSAPMVVNTKDGTCWTRRGSFRNGEALYAPEGVCSCPEFVMATLAELAEHGIAGSADVLPVPVAPEPQAQVHGAHAKVAELIGDAKPATDRLVEQLAESVRDRREHEHPTWEDLFCLNLVSWAGERMGPVLRRLLDAEARIAELESLTPAPIQTCRKCGAGYTYGEPCSTCEFRARMAAETDAITRRIAPVQALRDDEPETGGREEWCTGCNTDHAPGECGYRPEAGDQ
ncbi:hypothetical protein ACH5A2_19575 [Streptomyces collinus]|uniref:hypothetical protein n=1 Tax=Streptomyces collinus TaxID=42684 RepID=UPI00379370D6